MPTTVIAATIALIIGFLVGLLSAPKKSSADVDNGGSRNNSEIEERIRNTINELNKLENAEKVKSSSSAESLQPYVKSLENEIAELIECCRSWKNMCIQLGDEVKTLRALQSVASQPSPIVQPAPVSQPVEVQPSSMGQPFAVNQSSPMGQPFAASQTQQEITSSPTEVHETPVGAVVRRAESTTADIKIRAGEMFEMVRSAREKATGYYIYNSNTGRIDYSANPNSPYIISADRRHLLPNRDSTFESSFVDENVYTCKNEFVFDDSEVILCQVNTGTGKITKIGTIL